VINKEPNLVAKLDAFPFQFEAVNAIRDLDYAAIFFEQGLGKSKIAIDLILYWLESKQIDTILYVAKKSLLRNCEREFSIHSYVKPKILSQNRNSNFYVLNTASRLVLTNYEVLVSEFERLRLFLKSRNVAIILDESTKIKNPESAITKAAFELAPLFKKRVIMSGTPVANRPYDIWAQIFFLDQGKSLGTDYNEFMKNTDLSNRLYMDTNSQNRLADHLGTIYSKISKFTVRATKASGVIHLPEKTYQTILTDWEPRQYELYRQIQNDTSAIIVKNGVPFEDNSEEILKRLLRLVQVASNPHLIDQSYVQTPGKYEAVIDLVSSISRKNEKCIIWTSFIDNAEWLYRELKKFGTQRVHGSLSIETRNRAIDTFISDPKISILIATPGAAKEGLTLTVANHVIYYDRTFGLDDYLQSQDRIHRISQSKECYVYNLIMKDSIDEWVDILLQAKQLAAQLTQGDISKQYYQSHVSYDFGSIVKNILNIREILPRNEKREK
jgi:SNF2 family DNA or RNA helicase